MRRIIFLLVFIAGLLAPGATAQIVSFDGRPMDVDSVRYDFEHQPYFGLYKDNYFIGGPAIGQRITRENTNVKFQVSVAQRFTRSVLPFGTYLYLFYTQKVFWNVLQESLPMTDLNFNPGLGLTKPLFVKDRYIGKLTLLLEHESNGRDGDESRSWNKVSLACNIFIDKQIMVHGKAWIPIVDSSNNSDILHYCGLYQVGMQVMSRNQRFTGSLTLVRRTGAFFNYNSILELAYRFNRRDNQYFFLQYYNGYGEGLLDYNKFHSQLRVGIVIKPRFFSDY